MTVSARFRGILDSFWLKNIMLVLMVLDHLYEFLFPGELLFAHYLARVVAPVFAFLMAQGMVYTRDRRKYILRLFAASIVMAVGNLILSAITDIHIPNNIFLSLAAGAALIFCLDKAREDTGSDIPPDGLKWTACATAVVIASFFCEGQYLMPLMGVIFYYMRKNPVQMYTVFIAATGVPYLVSYSMTGTLDPQFWMVCSVLPIMLYNGGCGPSGAAAKYFFYAFYPLHIWIIVLIKFLCF